MTVGRPVQIFALVALLGVVGGIGSLALHKSPTAKPPVIEKHATAAPAHAKPKVAAPAKPKPVATKPAAPHKLFAANGLPMALAKALRVHRVVVISLFDPQSRTDAIAFSEARAGARAAGAGFLAVNLLDNAVAGPLTAVQPAGTLLPEPGLLIYRRPGVLVQRIDGFSDRDAVAQLAAASRTAPALTGPGS